MNTNKRIQTSVSIIYPKLSYQIMGILFGVHNELGNQLQEKIYQSAVAQRLKKAGLTFEKEWYLPVQDSNYRVGKYFLDFIIDEKIALELKAAPVLTNSDIRQLLGYLQVANLKLGILVNFRTRLLTYRRVVNPKVVIK